MVLVCQLEVMSVPIMLRLVGATTVRTPIFLLLMQQVSMFVAMGVVVVIVLLVPASRAKNVIVLVSPQASPVRNVEVLVAQASRVKPEWSLHMSNFKLGH